MLSSTGRVFSTHASMAAIPMYTYNGAPMGIRKPSARNFAQDGLAAWLAQIMEVPSYRAEHGIFEERDHAAYQGYICLPSDSARTTRL